MPTVTPFLQIRKALRLRHVLREYNKEHNMRLSSAHLNLLIFIHHFKNPHTKQLGGIINWKRWVTIHKPYLTANNLIQEQKQGRKTVYTITPDGIATLDAINHKLAYSRLKTKKA